VGEDFFDAEEDLYGVQCDLDEESIAWKVMGVLESLAREKVKEEV